jgi:HD-GYP domain-containing protein (c-di-GMP phosphodiesterase class II)
MSTELLVTQDLTTLTSRLARVWEPGQALPVEPVLLASSRVAAQANAAERAAGLWIVVGEPTSLGGWQPFLLLPDGCSGRAVDSAVDAGIEILRLRASVAERGRAADQALERQLDLVRVGIALTGERDLKTLLQLILTTARELVQADAGSLYLIRENDGERTLHFIMAQNDSVPLSLGSATMALDPTSLAGYVALSGESVILADAHSLPEDVPYRFNQNIDFTVGYHTRSLLTTPISTRAGDVIGVLQLLNRRRVDGVRILDAATADEVVVPFGPEDVVLIQALAAQAAVAIENTRLVQEIERLFEGFVRASVSAIEQRDPTTSGHSQRVAHYTVGLARAVERAQPPSYTGLNFSHDAIVQLRYAALLHDFGKVGVPEAVLRKGKKVFPERLALIEERFRHARRAHEVQLLRKVLNHLVDLGRAPTSEDVAWLEAAVRLANVELDRHFAAILTANEPTVLNQETSHLLVELRSAHFPGGDAREVPLLFPDELRALSVSRGSLDEAERLEIEAHVVHSYEFLLKIPWPRRYARVPGIAYGHHEKLNGRGYPQHIVSQDIPAEVRMMTVCDIYDALTAGDRPYKPAVPHERALAVLEEEAKQGALDSELVKVSIESGLFLRRPDEPVTV